MAGELKDWGFLIGMCTGIVPQSTSAYKRGNAVQLKPPSEEAIGDRTFFPFSMGKALLILQLGMVQGIRGIDWVVCYIEQGWVG